METFRTIMNWFMAIWIVLFLVYPLLFVIIPVAVKSGELTLKKLFFVGIPLAAFCVFRCLYVDPYIPRWLDDIIGHW